MRGSVTRIRPLFAGLALLTAVSANACSSDDGEDPPTSPTTIAVTLREYDVVADPNSGPAGTFNFEVTNEGPTEMHDFVIFKTDLPPDGLPQTDNLSVDAGGEGVELINATPVLKVGEEATLSADLAAGKYVLVCNFVEIEPDGLVEAHYQVGMRTAFTVK